jgi:hypothetical protein
MFVKTAQTCVQLLGKITCNKCDDIQGLGLYIFIIKIQFIIYNPCVLPDVSPIICYRAIQIAVIVKRLFEPHEFGIV